MSGWVLIVGSYPPIPVPGAAASLDEVRRAWASGFEVKVAAPRLAAAHLTVPVSGPLAGRRLRNLRRVTGADRVVLVIEDGYPVPLGSLARQAATVATLVPALREFGHVRLVRAGAPHLAPGLWSRLAAVADETADVDAPPAAGGVTPLGPPEEPPPVRAKRVVHAGVSRALGPRAPAFWSRVGRLRQAAGRLS